MVLTLFVFGMVWQRGGVIYPGGGLKGFEGGCRVRTLGLLES